jgi:hypothetical protein
MAVKTANREGREGNAKGAKVFFDEEASLLGGWTSPSFASFAPSSRPSRFAVQRRA